MIHSDDYDSDCETLLEMIPNLIRKLKEYSNWLLKLSLHKK